MLRFEHSDRDRHFVLRHVAQTEGYRETDFGMADRELLLLLGREGLVRCSGGDRLSNNVWYITDAGRKHLQNLDRPTLPDNQ